MLLIMISHINKQAELCRPIRNADHIIKIKAILNNKIPNIVSSL